MSFSEVWQSARAACAPAHPLGAGVGDGPRLRSEQRGRGGHRRRAALDGDRQAPLPRLPHEEVAATLETGDAGRASDAAKLCVRSMVQMAARAGEARRATWDEIHRAAREWRIRSERIEAGMDHRVPLGDARCSTKLEIDASLKENALYDSRRR